MRVRSTNAEVVGAGRLWRGDVPDDLRLEFPRPYPAGTPVGQHLNVVRLARVAERRHVYIVDTQGARWTKRKCWNCGLKFHESFARTCSYCRTPLKDLQFLMTCRWNPEIYNGTEDWVRMRRATLGLISPVALLYRAEQLLSVYHYNDESLLLDEAAPLPGDVVLSIAIRLAGTLGFMHNFGVRLDPFDASNVVVMPDGSVRWFDLDIREVLGDGRTLYRHPEEPVARDMRNLGDMLVRYVPPEDEYLAGFLREVQAGSWPSPARFVPAAEQLLASRPDVEPPEPKVRCYSDLGLCRSINEDYWGYRKVSDRLSLYVVADGMGGHEAGEVASRLATETLIQSFIQILGASPPDLKRIEDALGKAMVAANDRVFAEGKAQGKPMGTTLVAAAVFDGHHVVVSHAGDSRAYLLHHETLKRLTSDHTLVQALVDEKKITEAEAKVHPRANVVLVTVGAEKGVLDCDTQVVQAKPGDKLLLCTDGLWGAIDDLFLRDAFVEGPTDRAAVQRLVRLAYQHSGKDNLTVQAIQLT